MNPTKSFVLTDEIVAFLEERARTEERSMSYIVRRIIQGEMKLYHDWSMERVKSVSNQS